MQKDAVRIDNWSVTGLSDVYTPPEHAVLALQGNVTGHPIKKDGQYIVTSQMLSAKGRIVTCLNRKYYLGKIDPKYRRWLRKERPDWNWREPIRTVDLGEE
jgi:hypothetical protein